MAEDSNPVGRPTVRDFYKQIYKLYNTNITYAEAVMFLPEMTFDVFPIFVKKLKGVGEKVEKRKINQRIISSRHRKAWWGVVISTDDGTINANSVIELLKNQSFQCKLCGVYLDKKAHKQLDHIKPVSKSGKHILSNVQWLCRSCNIKKKDKYNG